MFDDFGALTVRVGIGEAKGTRRCWKFLTDTACDTVRERR